MTSVTFDFRYGQHTLFTKQMNYSKAAFYAKAILSFPVFSKIKIIPVLYL